ncbi:MAG: hypothetical protein WB767_03590 [Nocardioides sp.]
MNTRIVAIVIVVAMVASTLGVAISVIFNGGEESGFSTDGPVLASQPLRGIPDAAISGQLQLNGDCLLLDNLIVVWPFGTTWDDQAATVVTDDGSRYPVGSLVAGGGGVGGFDDSTGDPDDFFGNGAERALLECAESSGSTSFVFVAPQPIAALPIP